MVIIVILYIRTLFAFFELSTYHSLSLIFQVNYAKMLKPPNANADDWAFGAGKACGNRHQDDLIKRAFRDALDQATVAMFGSTATEGLSFFEEHQLISQPTFQHTFAYRTEFGSAAVVVRCYPTHGSRSRVGWFFPAARNPYVYGLLTWLSRGAQEGHRKRKSSAQHGLLEDRKS